MNYTYIGNQQWSSCCSSTKHTYTLPQGKRVVALNGFITKFINWPNRGQVSLPANVAILNLPEDLIDLLLAENLVRVVSTDEFSNGVLI